MVDPQLFACWAVRFGVKLATGVMYLVPAEHEVIDVGLRLRLHSSIHVLEELLVRYEPLKTRATSGVNYSTSSDLHGKSCTRVNDSSKM